MEDLVRSLRSEAAGLGRGGSRFGEPNGRAGDRPRRCRQVLLTAAAAGIALAPAAPALAGPTLAHDYSFNDGTANDSVAGANGTLVNSATVSGGSLVLNNNGTTGFVAPGNANNQYLDLPNQIISDTSNYTVEGWATWGGGNNWQRFFDFGSTSAGELSPTATTTGYTGTNYTFISPHSGNNTYYGESRFSGTSDIVQSPAGFDFNTGGAAGAEHNFVLSKAGSTLSLYRDGALIARSTTATHTPATTDLVNDWLGRSQFAGDPFYKGNIDEFRIYNGGMTAAQALLNATLGPDTLTATTNTWTAAGAGDWNNGANWSLDVPGAGQNPVVNNGGNPTVSTNITYPNQLTLNNGTLTVNNGATFSVAGGIDLAPGSTAGATANIAVTGGSVLSTGAIFTDADTTTTGTSPKTLTLDNGTLQASLSFTLPAGVAVTLGAGGGTIDTGANAVLAPATIGGSGALTKLGAGILALSGANTFTGTVNLNAGLVNFAAAGNLGTNTTINFNGGGLQWATGTTTDISATRTLNFQAGGATLDTNGNNVTLASPIGNGGAGSLTKAGGGTLTLTGTNTYSGNTTVAAGTLNFTTLANLGTGTGLTLGSPSAIGTLQWAAGNTTDITVGRTVTIGGATGSTGTGAGFDTNGNNVTLSGNLVGTNTGVLTKFGAGTLTLGGTTYTPTSFFVRGGTLTFNGGSVTTTSFISIGQANGDNGTLIVRNGSKVTVATDFNVSDISVSKGSLFVQDTGTQGTAVALRTLYVGKSGTSIGAVNQAGGTVGPNAAPSGDWRIGGGGGTGDAGAVGTYDLTAGAFNTGQNFQIGAFGKGQFNVTGGTATVSGGFNSVGRFGGSVGQLNVSGGAYNFTSTGTQLSAAEQGTGSINVYGAGTLTTASNSGLNLSLNGGTGQVNLGTGGTIGAKLVFQGTAAGTSGTFNFHGGTLRATAASTTFMQGLTNAYVWSEGGAIDTNGNNITVAQNLLAPPAGNGVGSVAVGTGGAGYVSAPIVQFTRGTGDTTGVGATGVATINPSGVVTGITITNPGTGYTVAPTVALLGGNPTTAAGAPTAALVATASGGLTKLGAGTLTLTGVNTYTGTTAVNAGALLINAATTGQGAFSIASAATLGGTGNIGLASGAVTVSPGGTLAPGNGTTPGSLTVTGAGSGNAVTFSAGSNYKVILTHTAASELFVNNGNITLGGANLVLAPLDNSLQVGDTFTIIDPPGAINGQFATGTAGTSNGISYTLAYNTASTPETVTLTVTGVPEPASVGLLALGAAGLLSRRRRKMTR